MKQENFLDFESAPAVKYVKVIGFDESAENCVKQLSNDRIIESEMWKGDKNLTEDLKIVILLCGSVDDRVRNSAATLAGADVLSLLITSEPCEVTVDGIDSMAVVAADRFTETIRDLLRPIENPGIINLDFYDLKSSLAKSGRFRVRSPISVKSGAVSL